MKMRRWPQLKATGIIKATILFSMLVVGFHAQAELNQLQIDNARAVTLELINPEVQALEAQVQDQYPGWKVSTFDVRNSSPQLNYMVMDIPLIAKMKHLGNVNRVIVRAAAVAYSPDGKETQALRHSYRVLVDITPEGKVIRAEKNYWNNMMSGEVPLAVLYDTSSRPRPDWAR